VVEESKKTSLGSSESPILTQFQPRSSQDLQGSPASPAFYASRIAIQDAIRMNYTVSMCAILISLML
jgi:hypothetical protein